MTNVWHDVHYGEDAPENVTAVIEIPRRSRAKYEICKDTGLLRLDRVLYSAVYYPTNYGFIPQTLGEDNDPLDIMVISMIDAQPLCVMDAHVIGVMRMVDNGEGDDKIIAVADGDISVAHIRDMDHLPKHFISEIEHFFQEYKRLEGKNVEVNGFEGKASALKIVQESIERYKETYGKKAA